MGAGNWNKPPIPRRADVPKQKGQGRTVPKGVKAARGYTAAPATGKPPRVQGYAKNRGTGVKPGGGKMRY